MNIHCTVVQGDTEPRLTWSECFLRALDQVQTPLALYFQEDYFLHQPVRADIVQASVDYMMAHPDVEHIALTRHGSHGPYETHAEEWLQGIRQKARYRISTQAALWRVDALKSYIRAKENGWMFEVFGTWRAHNKNAVFLYAKFDEAHGGPAFDYLHTGVIKGKWLSAIQPVFAAHGIQVDYTRRGFFVPKHPLLHKFDVGRKLLERPSLLVAALSQNVMFKSSVFVTVIGLLGSILGFVGQLLLARLFGAGTDVDAYLFTLSLPTFLAGMMGAALSYSFVPSLVLLEDQPEYQRRYLATAFLGISGVAMGLLVFGTLIGWEQIRILPSISPIRQRSDLGGLIMLGWFISACQVIQAFLIAALNASRKHLQAALLGPIPYLGVIFFLLVWGHTGRIAFVSIGLLLGTIASAIAAVYLLRNQLFPMRSDKRAWSDFKELLSSIPFIVVALSCFSAYSVVDAYWAPRSGNGVLATLGYAQRIMIGLGTFAVAGPSAVFVPYFSDFVRENNYKDFRRFFIQALMMVGGIAVFIALFLMVFSNDLVRLLFVRGAFGVQESIMVANTLRHMALGMIEMLMSVIILRALFCMEGVAKIAAGLGLLWTTLYFSTSYFLYPQGAAGLALGYSLAWSVFFIIVLTVIFRRINILEKQGSKK